MFISRKVSDPRWPEGNKAARSYGLYGHTPKFWRCDTTDFFKGPPLYYWGWEEDEWQAFCQEQADKHKGCHWPYRHLSSMGYLRLRTKWRVFTWWYHQPHPRVGGPVWFESWDPRKSRFS